MKIPPRVPVIGVHDEWNEWHEKFLLTGKQVVEWTAPYDVLVQAVEVDFRLKMAREHTAKLRLDHNSKRFEWDAASLSPIAYATRYMRLKEDILQTIEAFMGTKELLCDPEFEVDVDEPPPEIPTLLKRIRAPRRATARPPTLRALVFEGRQLSSLHD